MKRRTFLKIAGAAPTLSVLSAVSNSPVNAAEQADPNQPQGEEILKKLMDVKKGVGLCWLGNAGWLIRCENCLAAFDLTMELETLLTKSPVSTAELAPFLDVHFVTHSHSDHFNDATCKILVEKSKCLFVIPANCVKKAETIGIPQDRLAIAKPKEPFDLPNIHVEPLRALHGQKSFSVASYSNNEDCGYLLTIAGKKIFQPGDTVLLQEHLDLKGVNILFVSPTVHNTYIDRSAILINTIEPDHIFPQHFDAFAPTEETLFWAKGYPDELKAALPKPMQARYHKLPPGQIFVVE